MDNKKEYILCAAWKRKSPRKELGDNDIYKIEIGHRHGDIYEKFGEELSLSKNSMGFFTSKGRFVTRIEASKIAYKAGQISENTAKWLNKEIVEGLNKIDYIGESKKSNKIVLGDWKPLASEDLY